jgi:hypothetical protein
LKSLKNTNKPETNEKNEFSSKESGKRSKEDIPSTVALTNMEKVTELEINQVPVSSNVDWAIMLNMSCQGFDSPLGYRLGEF